MPSFFVCSDETEGNNNFGKGDTGPDSVSKGYSYYSVNQIQSTHEQNELAFMSEIFFHFIFLIWTECQARAWRLPSFLKEIFILPWENP